VRHELHIDDLPSFTTVDCDQGHPEGPSGLDAARDGARHVGPDSDGNAVANRNLGQMPRGATIDVAPDSIPVEPLLLGQNEAPGVVTPKIVVEQRREHLEVAVGLGRSPLTEDQGEV
jgi:hypothetical protein